MTHRQPAVEARSRIRKRYNDGLRFRKIAQLIGRSPGTVSGERNRGRTHMYDIPSSHRAKETRGKFSRKKARRVL